MRWLVMRSKPNREAALRRELDAREIEVFYPEIRVHPVNPRSRTARAFFPGYLFVHIDPQRTGFSDLNWVPFSQGLVSFDGGVSEVPDHLIHKIQKQVEAINSAGGEQLQGLRRGERIRITGGPFAGYEAIFDLALPGKERVRVLLELLSRQRVPATVPTGFISKN